MRKALLFFIFCFASCNWLAAQSLASPYSISKFPSQIFSSSGQTGTVIQLNGLTVPSLVGTSFASGSITVTGTSLTTATFAIWGSGDGGVTFYPLPIANVATPGSFATTTTVTANGLYWVSLAGLTHVEFVTSGTFTASNITLTLSASPNANISMSTGSGGDGVITWNGRNGDVTLNATDVGTVITGLTGCSTSGYVYSPEDAECVAQSSSGGTVTSVAASLPLTGGPITGAGTLACPTCTTSASTLPANELLAGAGGQAVTSIASDTNPDHVLLAAASGPPAFGALPAAAVPTLNQDTTGNAATATALAADPSQCSGGTPLATGVAANGDANCTAGAAAAVLLNPGTGVNQTVTQPYGTVFSQVGGETTWQPSPDCPDFFCFKDSAVYTGWTQFQAYNDHEGTFVMEGPGMGVGTPGSWYFGAMFSDQMYDYSESIGQMHSIQTYSYHRGDGVGIYDNYIFTGDAALGDDEGSGSATFKTSQLTTDFNGTVNTGSTGGTPTLTYVSGDNNFTGASLLLDLSSSTAITGCTLTGAAAQVGTSYLEALPVTGCSLPTSTAFGISGTAITGVNGGGAASQTLTVTLGIPGVGTASGDYAAGQDVWIAGPGMPEEVAVTAVGTPSGGYQTITIASPLYTQVVGAAIFQGGLISRAFVFSADYQTTGMRMPYYAFGSITGTDLIYGDPYSGGVVPGDGVTANELPASGAESATVAPCPGGSPLTNCNGLTVYYAAKIDDVKANLNADHSPVGTSYIAALGPNSVPWTSTDPVEDPPIPNLNNNGLWDDCELSSKSTANTGGHCLGVTEGGPGATFFTPLLDLRNENNPQYYIDHLLTPPPVMVLNGAYQDFLDPYYPPSSGSFFNFNTDWQGSIATYNIWSGYDPGWTGTGKLYFTGTTDGSNETYGVTGNFAVGKILTLDASGGNYIHLIDSGGDAYIAQLSDELYALVGGVDVWNAYTTLFKVSVPVSTPQVIASGSAPTCTVGAAAGTGATCTVTGTNMDGVLTLTTGTGTTGGDTMVTVNLNGTLATAYQGCAIQPRNAAAALEATDNFTTAPSTTAWTVADGATAVTASTAMSWSYHCE